MTPQAAYDELIRRVREQATLGACIALLEWDELTYMPPGGVAGRAQQLAYLAGLEHGKATDPRLGELLAVVEGSPLLHEPTSAEAVNVREIRRSYMRLARLPRTLVEEVARVAPVSQHHWAMARQEGDFELWRPWLEKMVALKRQEAQCLSANDPYDALLDDYEPGARSDDIARLFAALRQELTPLLAAIAQSRKKPRLAILRRHYSLEQQRSFGMEVAAALGFDFQRGRLDTAVHPFSSRIGPGDCRITTRYSPNQFSDSFFAILHEVGHALYEQGLDPAADGTPMGEPPSLGMHEAQSRLWENLVGRSLPFWKHFFPRARQVFPEALGEVSLNAFYLAINHVAPSLNRVQSDEVTYNLHILIRFELEKDLLSGDLPVADLPAAWNRLYQKYLGLTPGNDADGCLQDGHWSEGMFGYFPTYTLGNLFAAQLFDRVRAEIGNLAEQFHQGDFRGLLTWLRRQIYLQGSRYRAGKLIEIATGKPPDHGPLVRMLREKYGELYGI